MVTGKYTSYSNCGQWSNGESTVRKSIKRGLRRLALILKSET